MLPDKINKKYLTAQQKSGIMNEDRGVAQLVARMVRDHKVVGSNPVASTKFLPDFERFLLKIRLFYAFLSI